MNQQLGYSLHIPALVKVKLLSTRSREQIRCHPAQQECSRLAYFELAKISIFSLSSFLLLLLLNSSH